MPRPPDYTQENSNINRTTNCFGYIVLFPDDLSNTSARLPRPTGSPDTIKRVLRVRTVNVLLPPPRGLERARVHHVENDERADRVAIVDAREALEPILSGEIPAAAAAADGQHTCR